MEFNVNKIKKLMLEEDMQPLPPELDWNNMKEGIFDKIQSIEEEEFSQRKNKDSRKRMGLFLILFFALTLALFSVLQKQINNQKPEDFGLSQLTERDKPLSSLGENSLSLSDDQIEYQEEGMVEKNRMPKENDLLLAYEEPELNLNSQNVTGVQKDFGLRVENRQLDETDLSSKLLRKEDVTFTQHSSKSLQKVAGAFPENSQSSSMQAVQEIQALEPYRLNPIRLEKIKISKLRISDSKPSDPGFTKYPNQLVLEGGITFWNEGYGRNKPDRSIYEAPLPSFQLQGHYMMRLKRNYFFMAGLQYQRLESKLRYNNIIENYRVLLTDTIVQVQNNLLNGKQNNIRGDVEQFVRAEHRIRHYNKTQLFKLSLAVGKSWRFKSFQTDVYIGGALNSLVQNQGRMFFEGEIMDYNGNSNSFFQNQWTVDGVMGARFHYFITQGMGVTTAFQTHRSLMNWSNQEGTKFYPASLSLQLGLSYSL